MQHKKYHIITTNLIFCFESLTHFLLFVVLSLAFFNSACLLLAFSISCLRLSALSVLSWKQRTNITWPPDMCLLILMKHNEHKNKYFKPKQIKFKHLNFISQFLNRTSQLLNICSNGSNLRKKKEKNCCCRALNLTKIKLPIRFQNLVTMSKILVTKVAQATVTLAAWQQKACHATVLFEETVTMACETFKCSIVFVDIQGHL